MRRRKGLSKLLMLMAVLIIVVLISISPSLLHSNDHKIYLKGSGASFPYPLLQELIERYEVINPSVEIDYASVGSGAGQADLLNRLVDYAGSDAPLTNEQLESVDSWILHLPYALGAVVITYNLPSARDTLRLTPEIISLIFGGVIEKWNDPRIVRYNPWLAHVEEYITVVHRSDSSGTTYIFTLFLSKESDFWREHYGTGKMISWPNIGRFVGGKGNEGVAGLLKQTPYSIGYIEFTYAYKESLPMAEVMNKAGAFVAPSILSIEAASNVDLSKLDPRDLRISDLIIDSNVSNAYPISAPTYILVYEDWSVYNGDKNVIVTKMEAFKEWMMWIILDGSQYYYDLGYVPISSTLANKVLEAIELISYRG